MERRKMLKLMGSAPIASAIPLSGLSEPRKKRVNQQIINGKNRLVIYGATPGGVACAIRAARQGITVTLVNHNNHIGGIFSSGLSTMDTLYNGARSPVYDEYRYLIYEYYRTKYGTASDQYERTNPGYPKTRYEASIAEMLMDKMVEREEQINLIRGYFPIRVLKDGNRIQSVRFQEKDGSKTISVEGEVFADCSYEGDLLALSGLQYRVGRESRDEFGEAHAGVAWVHRNEDPSQDFSKTAINLSEKMDLVRYNNYTHLIYPESTGESDQSVQAFNLRTVLTDNPDNRIIPDKPKSYDRDYIKELYYHHYDNVPSMTVPNSKVCWNHPEVVGEQTNYVHGDWDERERVTQKHRDITLSVLYFMQNDESVPQKWRKEWRKWGLPKDEFAENGHLPYEVYVREARRLKGSVTFTENDALLANDLQRAPIYEDSISVTEWFLDSHACTPRKINKTSYQEGEVMLKKETFPGQVSYRTLFNDQLENFMVPVCLSATHIGWGAIRLEPTWMSIGEAAAYAVEKAFIEKKQVNEIDTNELQILLASKRIMLSFFNDVSGREYSEWYPAIQYLGTKGFFSSYYARPMDKLNDKLAEIWVEATSALVTKTSKNAHTLAIRINESDSTEGEAISIKDFSEKLGDSLTQELSKKISLLKNRFNFDDNREITRGEASMLIFGVLNN